MASKKRLAALGAGAFSLEIRFGVLAREPSQGSPYEGQVQGMPQVPALQLELEAYDHNEAPGNVVSLHLCTLGATYSKALITVQSPMIGISSTHASEACTDLWAAMFPQMRER